MILNVQQLGKFSYLEASFCVTFIFLVDKIARCFPVGRYCFTLIVTLLKSLLETTSLYALPHLTFYCLYVSCEDRQIELLLTEHLIGNQAM